MALLKYFKKTSLLPNPNGPLSERMPSSSITSANKEVQSELNSDGETLGSKRGHYARYSDEERTQVAKRASEMGVTNSLRFFGKKFADHPLKESTVRTWKKQYEQEIKLRYKVGQPMEITKLECGKRGHPLLLEATMDKELQEYVKHLRDAGAVINAAIIMAAAQGIFKNHDSNLLQCNGGHVVISKGWAKSFLCCMGYVKRRESTKAKVNSVDFEVYKAQFLLDVKTVVEIEEILKELVINWDCTGIQYVPVSSWTMAKEGSKAVEITGINGKRQITAVFADTMSGDFLPPQIIYSGKTPR